MTLDAYLDGLKTACTHVLLVNNSDGGSFEAMLPISPEQRQTMCDEWTRRYYARQTKTAVDVKMRTINGNIERRQQDKAERLRRLRTNL